MGDILLVTGGSRSGKSALAQRLAETLPGPRTFVATWRVGDDDEMVERVHRHREARARGDWITMEEPLEVAAALRRSPAGGVTVVDCLTIWVSNLMWRAAGSGNVVRGAGDGAAEAPRPEIDECHVSTSCRTFIEAARELPGTCIFVTNEVGLGVVPENAVARRYRDLVGRCNQTVAEAADAVVLAVCGIPVVIKGGDRLPGSLASALPVEGR